MKDYRLLKIVFFSQLFISMGVMGQYHGENLILKNEIQKIEKNIVLLNNSEKTIPLKNLPDLRIASIHFNYNEHASFDSICNKYWEIAGYSGDNVSKYEDYNSLHDELKFYNLVFIELSHLSKLTPALKNFILELRLTRKVIVIYSGKELNFFDGLSIPIIWYSDDNNIGASIAAQIIFGGIGIQNRLEKNFTSYFRRGAGFSTKKIRLGYSIPEDVGINSDYLKVIDSIAYEGIHSHSEPAVVILLAKNGEVIYNKGFGKHTYFSNDTTRIDDIFDLASVTKVTATTPAIMHLYELKQINLDSPISKYVHALRSYSDKVNIKVREALLHEAGFVPYIKFYEFLKPDDTSPDSSSGYPTKVADNYYLKANYFSNFMWPMILSSKVLTRGKYVYSDVSMYMMKEVFENVEHERIDQYLLSNLYKPLGMSSTGFLPRNRFPKKRIIRTTENDNWFRSMPVQGYVNDPGAAMAGGVEGHAGLFSNSNDLAIYYQMLLNKGSYGGEAFFDSSTVNYFTSRQSKITFRGLGFDKADMDSIKPGELRSSEAFGHSGYTGTFVWVDPKYKMVFICLTNRVYPDDGRTFGHSKVDVRGLTLKAFYNAVGAEL